MKQGTLTPPPKSTEKPIMLSVYVGSHCWQCAEARSLAEQMQREFAAVRAHIVDLDLPSVERPANVFAVPTFLLEGKVISIGTPTLETLRKHIRNLLAKTKVSDEPRQDRISALE